MAFINTIIPLEMPFYEIHLAFGDELPPLIADYFPSLEHTGRNNKKWPPIQSLSHVPGP
jgi:hypothetical protein